MTEIVSTRTSRSRRVVALMGWGCLVVTAFLLWNARQTGSIRAVTAEPVAFILASFAAFVGVFAWMLFNPGRRSAAESPSLFFAAAATLFPPPIIGFCLLPVDSELRGWLALGLFLLCVIAVLSHVPDEFFGVPRGRHTYFIPIPAFDRVEGTVLDPNSSWFRFEDLTRIVSDTERPSLAPKSYLQRDVPRTAPVTQAQVRMPTEVDDILGSDFELGLLDDPLLDDTFREDDLEPRNRSRNSEPQRSTNPHSQPNERSSDDAPRMARDSATATHTARSTPPPRDDTPPLPPQPQPPSYQIHNPESRHLRTNQQHRREATRQQLTRRSLSRSVRQAPSLQVEPTAVRGSLSDALARSTADQSTTDQSTTDQSTTDQSTTDQSTTDRSTADRPTPDRPRRDPAPTSRPEPVRSEPAVRTEPLVHLTVPDRPKNPSDRNRNQDAVSARVTPARVTPDVVTSDSITPPPLTSDVVTEKTPISQQVADSYRGKRRVHKLTPRSTASDSSGPHTAQAIAAAAAAVVPATVTRAATDSVQPAKSFGASSVQAPRQLMGQTVQRERVETPAKSPAPLRHQDDVPAETNRTGRRSRYDNAVVPRRNDQSADRSSASPPSVIAETTAAPLERSTGTATKAQQQPFQRTKDAEGSELVEGVMRVHFDKGQKRANVHVPFSPPLAGIPEVECECVDGDDLRLKVPVRQSYGIRIEARRSNTTRPLDANIGFAALCEAPESA